MHTQRFINCWSFFFKEIFSTFLWTYWKSQVLVKLGVECKCLIFKLFRYPMEGEHAFSECFTLPIPIWGGIFFLNVFDNSKGISYQAKENVRPTTGYKGHKKKNVTSSVNFRDLSSNSRWQFCINFICLIWFTKFIDPYIV